ncbi:2803_t:CDS:2, partial [Entrophospora sp. SA101]
LFESLKFDRIYKKEMSEYGGYRYLINMNSVEFSIQEDDSLNNYDCENELSDEMKSSKENAGSDEK